MKERWLFVVVMLFLVIPLSFRSDGVSAGEDGNSEVTVDQLEKTSGKYNNKGCD